MKEVNSSAVERFEKTKLWREVIKNSERFEKEEKEFFLECIKSCFLEKRKMKMKYFASLIEAISRHYDPSGEAKRIKLVLLIKEI